MALKKFYIGEYQYVDHDPVEADTEETAIVKYAQREDKDIADCLDDFNRDILQVNSEEEYNDMKDDYDENGSIKDDYDDEVKDQRKEAELVFQISKKYLEDEETEENITAGLLIKMKDSVATALETIKKEGSITEFELKELDIEITTYDNLF